MALTAAQFNAIKRRIANEMRRRQYNGSLYSNATIADNTPNAVTGNPITAQQGQGTIDLVLQIKDYSGLAKVKQGDLVPSALENLSSVLTTLENEPMTYGGSSSCRSTCTGLCTTQCQGNCTSCTSCSGNCSGTCGGGCGDSCYGCVGGCNGACSGCTGGCYTGCKSTCETGCKSGCTSCTGCQGCKGTSTKT